MSDVFVNIKELSTPMLGLDIGDARIGVAFAPKGSHIAVPLPTIHEKNTVKAVSKIISLCHERSINAIVVGWPLHMDGQEGDRCQKVLKFCELLWTQSDFNISHWDERLSSVFSHKITQDFHVKRTKKKETIDANSAIFILQGALDMIFFNH
jgi:putative Holliday junction resolvase